MKVKSVMTAQQYAGLRQRLFPPGDPDEQFSCGITSISTYPGGCNLLLRWFLVADKSCLVKQSGASVRPDPRFVEYVWTLAEKSRSSLIDSHTHPFCRTQVQFSPIDDHDEKKGFPKMVARLGPGPHASMVLGTQSLDARWYDAQTGAIKPIAQVTILGENLRRILPTSANPPAQNRRLLKGESWKSTTVRYEYSARRGSGYCTALP
jgi:hypothetical protein